MSLSQFSICCSIVSVILLALHLLGWVVCWVDFEVPHSTQTHCQTVLENFEFSLVGDLLGRYRQPIPNISKKRCIYLLTLPKVYV